MDGIFMWELFCPALLDHLHIEKAPLAKASTRVYLKIVLREHSKKEKGKDVLGIFSAGCFCICLLSAGCNEWGCGECICFPVTFL